MFLHLGRGGARGVWRGRAADCVLVACGCGPRMTLYDFAIRSGRVCGEALCSSHSLETVGYYYYYSPYTTSTTTSNQQFPNKHITSGSAVNYSYYYYYYYLLITTN